jgi:hypothetical protein
MTERPHPDLDRVRKALQERDEAVPEPQPDEPPDEDTSEDDDGEA